MKLLTAPRARRTLIALTAALSLAILVAGIGIYGLVIGSEQPTESTDPPLSSAAPSAEPSREPTSPSRIPSIPPTTDAEAFARSVAAALFTWDTGSAFLPLDYTAVILDVADPTGFEQSGLAADIATYLPTSSAWAQLRPYATTQRLEITSVFVPDTWADALAQARPGQLPDGAAAYTIEGIRQRSGVWNGDSVTAEHPVAFTIFIACPAEDPCYVLRLSQLNLPLR
ncbi:MAG: hypothetical protein JSS74_11610 [Actinobacteria bacterium]|nr:hypothetical protein [Actinomycetota bacterium]MCK9518641.1 hypothetical protein [Dehalococcoidia bacterium]